MGATPIKRPWTDPLEDAIFLISLIDTVPQDGVLNGWKMYSILSSLEIHLQIWRKIGGEDYMLISSTMVNSQVGTYNLTINETMVKTGDVLGIYFPYKNPIPWNDFPCYEASELLRYVYEPSSVEVGQGFTFQSAPLAWNPCRHYSLQALICELGHSLKFKLIIA